MKLSLEVVEIGTNQISRNWDKISDFVLSNWDALYIGAINLDMNIEADCYAPERIQIGSVRLHATSGLKIAGSSHKYDSPQYEDEDIFLAVEAVRDLLAAAARDINSRYTINIVEN